MVLFEYNTNIYSITQYQQESATEDKDSDVIQKNIEENELAATDILIIDDIDLKNIDAGFIQKVKFDFSLNKTINKIITQNEEGIKTIQCKGSKLAKTEINAKYVNNTTVSIEYNIEVKNEGEIAGYIHDIIDYMPQDLEFSQEMNKNWYINKKDGTLHNASLSNTVIKPGESKNLTLILTKEMTGQNTGMSVNIAEIGQATNELEISDEDSTPGNRKDGEDDISTAQLLTSIKTGINVYIAGSILIIGLISIFIIIIRKRRKIR